MRFLQNPDAFENGYMEEPLPEEEQVQPPEPEEDAEGGGAEANGTTNDAAKEKDASTVAA